MPVAAAEPSVPWTRQSASYLKRSKRHDRTDEVKVLESHSTELDMTASKHACLPLNPAIFYTTTPIIIFCAASNIHKKGAFSLAIEGGACREASARADTKKYWKG